MGMGSVFPWIVLSTSLTSAYICCKRRLHIQNKSSFILFLLTLWIVLLIVPVQFLGALQISGVIDKVTVAEVALIQVIIVAGSAAWSLAYRPLQPPPLNQPDIQVREELPVYLKLSAAIIVVSYLLFALAVCRTFPDGPDALVYHLPLALRWLQEGSLHIPVSKTWRLSVLGNGEILMMLALATGKQAFVVLGNWISLIVLLISVFSLAERFTNGKKAPAYAVLLIVLSIPIVEFQVFSAYVDLFGTAFLFAAVTLFLNHYRAEDLAAPTRGKARLSLSAIGVSALACGLSFGTKLTFCPYCALYFSVVALTLWRERTIHKKSVAFLIGMVIVGVLLPSVFWYGRAFEATGNPLYPMRIAIGDHVIFPGYESVGSNAGKLLLPDNTFLYRGEGKFVRRASEWWIYPWTEWLRTPGDFPVVYGEASGLGGAFATFVVVGIGFAFYLGFRGPESNQAATELRRSLLLWLFLMLLWGFVLHRILRFGLPIWVFGCVLAAPGIALLATTYPRVLSILLVSSILTQCVISSLVPLHKLAGSLVSQSWSRSMAYGYPAIIDELPPGTCILNDSEFPEQDFALAGKRLTNRVINAFEAPRELTPDFIASEGIDYVVRITADDHGEELPSAPLSGPVAGREVFHSIQAGKVWSIWRISKLAI